MSKRDYIAEISAKKQRLKQRGPRLVQFQARVDALIDVSNYLQKSKGSKEFPARAEMVKYLPIGWVACIEGYFRLVFRDLVNYGAPYRDNASALKEIRITLEHVVAMQAGKFSLGEFVAHLLPVNGLDDINQSMSTLLGVDYLEELKNTKTNLFQDDKSLEELGFSGSLYESLDYLFKQRHVFAHELTTKVKVRLKDIFHHSRGALILIMHNEILLEKYLGKST